MELAMRMDARFCLLIIVTTFFSCKARVEESQTQSGIGDAIDDLIPSEIVNYPRYQRNKNRPWSTWQWLPGARDDRGEESNNQILGLAGAGVVLDRTRA